MRPVRSAAAIAVAVTAGLALSACGSSGDGGSAKHHAAPKSTAQDVNPHPVSDLKQGGTFRMAIQQWIKQYNPYQVDGNQGDGASIAAMLLPQLYHHDGSGQAHEDTDFLTKATATVSGGKQTVTYDLNPKATWSDGNPLSWKDFQAHWKAVNGSNSKYIVTDPSGYNDIQSVAKGSNDHQVKVVFKTPYADWKKLFNPLLPAKAIDTPEKFNKGWVEKVPITANAWKMGTLDKTQQSITVVPDPKFWGTKPVLDKVLFRALSPDAQLDAYINGEIDYTSASTSEAYQRLKKAKDTDIRIGARWDEVHVTLNGAKGPLQDVRVRQAVETAISTKALGDIASKGMPFHVPALGNHFFMPNQAGYKNNAGHYGSGDVKAAGKLLDAAGWKSTGAGKPRTKDGKPLTLSFVMGADSTGQSVDQAEALQGMLKQAGIKMAIQKVPGNDFFDKYVNRGNFDLTSFRNVDAVFSSVLYPVFQQPKGSQVYQNYGRVSSPEIQKTLDKAGATVDPAQSQALYNKADKLIWDAGHSLEYYQRPQVLAVRHNIANFGASGLGDDDWTKVGFLKK